MGTVERVEATDRRAVTSFVRMDEALLGHHPHHVAAVNADVKKMMLGKSVLFEGPATCALRPARLVEGRVRQQQPAVDVDQDLPSTAASGAHGRVRRPASTLTLPALSLRGLGDRPDELTGLLLILLERDVGLRDHADEPAVLDNGQPPNLVAGH